METFTVIKGSEVEGLKCEFFISMDIGFSSFGSIVLTAFDTYTNINPLDLSPEFYNKLAAYCMTQYHQQAKFKRLEKDFLERLHQSIVIKDEHDYIAMLGVYEAETRDDNYMNDLNNDKI